jgi:hypothetical protein
MVVLELKLLRFEDLSQSKAQRHIITARKARPRRDSKEMEQHEPAIRRGPNSVVSKLSNVLNQVFSAAELLNVTPIGQSVDNMTRKHEEAYNVCKTLRHSLEKGCSGSDRGALRANNKHVIGVFNVRVTEAARRPQGGLSAARSTEPAGSRSFPLKGVEAELMRVISSSVHALGKGTTSNSQRGIKHTLPAAPHGSKGTELEREVLHSANL